MNAATRALLAAAALSILGGDASAQRLPRAAVLEDIDTLQAVVRRYSAYRLLNGYPFERHLDSLRVHAGDSVPLLELWRSIQTAVGRLQDAHSAVHLPRGMTPPSAGGTLPFALTSLGDTVIALAPCRCALLSHRFPRVVSIDGIRIDSLMRISGIRYAGHSPQRWRHQALFRLQPIESILQLAGRPVDGRVAVRLAGSRGDTTLTMATDSLPSGPVSHTVTAQLRGPIAVLRIPLMAEPGDSAGDAVYQMVRAAIESETFRRAPGMIIDVRGNDGGTRHILELLLPRFVRAPVAYNVVLLRADTNGVGERMLVSPDDWSHPRLARDALRAALASFRPSWEPPPGEFLSERFASVVVPAEPSRNMSDKSVVVLQDAGSFSATDIFLGAMSLAPNVTLMGTPSAGGSGRSRTFVLPRSRLRVVLSTMASFRPDGQLYDGVGVAPDVLVPPTLEGLATGRDTQLDAAVRYLMAKVAAKP
jgi:hypothetical protein